MEKINKFDWKKTIQPNIINLKVIGLWPKEDTYGFNIYTIYAMFSLIFFQVGLSTSQTVYIFTIQDDLEAVTSCVYVVFSILATVLKTITLMKNMKKLKMLMKTVDSDLFQPKSAKQRKMAKSSLRNWQIIAFTYWFFAATYAIFVALYPLVDKSLNQYSLPFLTWYPYNIKQSPHYELTYIYQFLALNYINMSNININPLINALNMYIGAQFDILTDDLKNINDNDDGIDANKKLRNCIHHHKEILKFADSANEFYNWLLFVEIFVDGFSIGIALFQVTVVIPFTAEFYSFVSYTVAILIQIFMYCFFGNEVESKSSKLSYAIFESDWTNFSPAVKQDLVIFVLRVQKSQQISAFGLFIVSLENFVKIMKTAWSYCALLRQVHK